MSLQNNGGWDITTLEGAQARIRELEAEKGKWEILAKSARNRIAKAKAILKEDLRYDSYIEAKAQMQDAIDALEGKDQEATTPLVRPEHD